MSRSYKLPIIKDKPRNYKKSAWYWRRVRRVLRQFLYREDYIPEPKEIVNDYDYSDYTFRDIKTKGKNKKLNK